jgi:hypothetical protein
MFCASHAAFSAISTLGAMLQCCTVQCLQWLHQFEGDYLTLSAADVVSANRNLRLSDCTDS